MRLDRQLVPHSPGRTLRPTAQGLLSPLDAFVRVAERARVWNFERLCRCRGDEAERMSVDFHIPKRLLDQRHVAGHALAARAIQLVMGGGGDALGERADRRGRPVAAEAQRVPFLAQHRDIVASMRIVT